MAANGKQIGDSGGFSAQHLIRSTKLQIYHKFSYEERPSPLRQTAVPVAQLTPNIVKDGLFTELKT